MSIKIAIQKSGKLAEGTFEILKRIGIKFQSNKDQLLFRASDFDIDFVLTRDDDILSLVEQNICNFGIIGENVLVEKLINQKFKLDLNNFYNQIANESVVPYLNFYEKLNFAQCRLSLAIPKEQFKTLVSLNNLTGLKIATSYPSILKNYLATHNVQANIVEMNGSVELSPKIGISDLICDLVSSGGTLQFNGLKEYLILLKSEAVLIGSTANLNMEELNNFMRFLLRIRAVREAQDKKYIMLHLAKNKLAELQKILPGSESPTILDLKDYTNKVAVHVVSNSNNYWQLIEELKALGATDILSLPIESFIK